MLSPQSVSTLVDILENRISVMDITDRDDLREMTVMKRCLNELSTLTGVAMTAAEMSMLDAPRRGRRKKLLHA